MDDRRGTIPEMMRSSSWSQSLPENNTKTALGFDKGKKCMRKRQAVNSKKVFPTIVLIFSLYRRDGTYLTFVNLT